VYSNRVKTLRRGLLSCVLLLGLGAACAYAGRAEAQEDFPSAELKDGLYERDGGGILVRRFRMRPLDAREGDEEQAVEAGTGDAKRFADRIKRHQRRHFAKKRREFKKHQLRVESQRRIRRASGKARQFAAARRRAAWHALRHTNAKPKARVKSHFWKRPGEKVEQSSRSLDGD